MIALTVNRTTWGFSERDKALLNALRPALFQTHWLLRQFVETGIARQGVSLHPHMRGSMIVSLRAKGLHRREAEVLALLAEGKTNQEIAEELTICEGTVRKHINRIYLKLGIHNRAAATRAALSLLHQGSSPTVPMATASGKAAPAAGVAKA